ncbi:DUF6933 domain-containing protein [Iodobacter arcticus]|uniref:DUF6933 domain-containing protein n=1 Tax=Iodobacter arcticus TaxID=590593 RepID=A0ABW2R0W9_9NEIS
MQFYCSKAAAEALETRRKGKVESWLEATPAPEAASPWTWQLHAIKVARHNVFIVMERETRFAMVFWGIKKGDGDTLLKQFYERMVNLLLWINEDVSWLSDVGATAAITQILKRDRYSFTSGIDRSVQTHINDVAWACELAFHTNGCLPNPQDEAANFDMKTNNTLRSIRGGDYFTPFEVFFCSWVREYAGATPAQCDELALRFQQLRREQPMIN